MYTGQYGDKEPVSEKFSAPEQTPNKEMETGEDIREELTNLVVTRGAGLLELTSQSINLEDVFKILTKPDTPAG